MMKPNSLDLADYAVFQDKQRHTCIRTKVSKKGVEFIPMDTTLSVVTLPHKEFEQLYVIHLKDYPVKQAAESYLGASWLGVSESAKRHLMHLTSSKFADAIKPLHFENKESIMTEDLKAKPAAKKVAAPATKKVAAPKTAPKAAPAAKKAAVPAAKKEAAPAAKKVAAKVAAPAGARTGTSKEGGKKITVLIKNPPVRPGSNREAQYKIILGCKNSDEAAEKLRDLTDKPWDVIRTAVQQEIISLH